MKQEWKLEEGLTGWNIMDVDTKFRIAIIKNEYRGKEKNRQNAKLISAAPDLLEFAIEMVKRYPNSPWISEQANAAIKKATT